MLQSVITALNVFEIVALHQPIGVTQVARRLDTGKSTVQRCLVTLEAAGWLRADTNSPTRWMITAKSLTLGRRVANSGGLREFAFPVMEQLRDETRETIHLVVPDGRDAVIIERVESPQSTRTFFPLGGKGPLHATATGKAILASYSEEKLATYLSENLEALTARTIGNAPALRQELSRVRKRGFATAVDEREEGASAIAAAIVNRAGVIMGALSISCPTSRFTKSERNAYAPLIVQSAKAIAEKLN